MSDKLYGQCAICGGSLTTDHKCWPIPPPTHKEWANESLRIALQNIQDAATKPLHIEIESLRSRLAEAESRLNLADAEVTMLRHFNAEAKALLHSTRVTLIEVAEHSDFREGEEFGVRSCCHVRDYRPHAESCQVMRSISGIDAFLAREERT